MNNQIIRRLAVLASILVALAIGVSAPASAKQVATATPVASVAVAAPATAPALLPAKKWCATGVYASGTASCPFARNVNEAYIDAGGARRLYSVYSPTTGRYYNLRCSGSYPVKCVTGRAVIYLYYEQSTDCGNDIWAGGTASCAFAGNVAQAYWDSGGDRYLYDVYSPASGKYYDLKCVGSNPVTCSVGRARIYIY